MRRTHRAGANDFRAPVIYLGVLLVRRTGAFAAAIPQRY